VRPDDWARLTVAETDSLLDWLAEYTKQMAAEAAKLGG
jgi:hypothetical protein